MTKCGMAAPNFLGGSISPDVEWQLSEVAVAKALSSDVSWKVLTLLMINELGEQEISKRLGIPTRLVKLHMAKLVQVGIVTEQEKTIHSGKVIRTYRISGTAKSIGFPPRNYLYFSEALINSLRKSLGEDSARMLLRDMGIRIGEDVAQALVSRTKLTTWNPNTYAQHFVKWFLAETGFQPKVVRVGRGQVVYQERNCLFEDLAVKYPGLMCDVLDAAVHEGIDKLGGMKTIRLKCKGHGDAVCEYRVQWQTSIRGCKTKLKADCG
jgi:predicted ArsR family transcriptional regulator